MTEGKPKQAETVPLDPPYGGITDGEWICGRCKEERVGCALCAGMEVNLVPYNRGAWSGRRGG